MTLIIDLPDELASRLAALLPEEERSSFSVAAIADALRFREDEKDCFEVVEQALVDMDAGCGLVTFEDICRQWDSEKVAHETPNRK